MLLQMHFAEAAAAALNNPLARAILPLGLRLWPGVMGLTAKLTRVAQPTAVGPNAIAT
jgi:hypothetical protein